MELEHQDHKWVPNGCSKIEKSKKMLKLKIWRKILFKINARLAIDYQN